MCFIFLYIYYTHPLYVCVCVWRIHLHLTYNQSENVMKNAILSQTEAERYIQKNAIKQSRK